MIIKTDSYKDLRFINGSKDFHLHEFLPRLITFCGDLWYLECFLNELFKKQIKIIEVVNFKPICDDIYYLVYQKGFKPTKQEINNAIKKFLPDQVRDMEEEGFKWKY